MSDVYLTMGTVNEHINIPLMKDGVVLPWNDASYELITGVDVYLRDGTPTGEYNTYTISTIDGKLGFLYTPPAVGAYSVRVQLTSTPQVPLLLAGTIFVSNA